MVVEAKKLRVGMNYCLFGNVFSHLWLLTRGAICKPAGLHMETCRIAYGNLRDCIWKPAGLHMETCGIAYGSQLDCFCQLDCIRDVQKMIAPSLIDEAMYRGGRKSFLAISSWAGGIHVCMKSYF